MENEATSDRSVMATPMGEYPSLTWTNAMEMPWNLSLAAGGA